VAVEIRLPADSAEGGRVRAAVTRSGKIIEEVSEDGFITMRARVRDEEIGRLEKISDVKMRRV
jgi:hypothetical protein